MALQDLTPQLRTRLSRMERAVGWFVVLATALLAFGFGYYVYNTAKRKGWFVTKARYFTLLRSADGLKMGDPVQLMGFDVGQITDIQAMPPRDFTYNVYVEFEIKDPNYGYMWTEGSRARVAAADFLGKRTLEVTKGTGGYPTYISRPVREITLAEAKQFSNPKEWRLAELVYEPGSTQLVAHPWSPLTNLAAIASAGKTQIWIMDLRAKKSSLTAEWNTHRHGYEPYSRTNKPYWLEADESPALTERMEALVQQVQTALPNILSLTNQLALVLSNSALLTSNLNGVAGDARPAVSNLAILTAQLNQPGALGEWLLPTNINDQLDATLTTANTNLAVLALNLNRSLENLADITGNLNSQVQANTNILSQISRVIMDTDNFVQGMKHHWLFRSAFKPARTNVPPVEPLRSPREMEKP